MQSLFSSLRYAAFTGLISPLGFLLPGQTPVWAGVRAAPAAACVAIGVLAVANQVSRLRD
jgi:hypothetical protein